MTPDPLFRVVLQNQNDTVEVYARQIFQSELWGFIEMEEFVFEGNDVSKALLSGVKRSYVPMTNIIRIDEFELDGTARNTEKHSTNVRSFPSRVPQPVQD